MGKFLGLLYGGGAYVFFLATFLYSIGFVGNCPDLRAIDTGPSGDRGTAFLIDVLLLGLFAVQHSVMARRGFKHWWVSVVPPVIERSTYVLASTALLALLMWQWRAMPDPIWTITDPMAVTVLRILFWLGWGIVLISTFLISHFDLFGLRQVWAHFRDRLAPPAPFVTPLFYQFVRHPIYLGFILAFWATPQMSEGHLLFAVATTGYIFIGIFLEERDLVAHFGESYREYRKRVPMILPFIGGRKSN